MKYTKRQIIEAIEHWKDVLKKMNESLLPFDSEGLSRNLDNIVARLNEQSKEKFKYDIDNLKSLLKDLPSKTEDNIPLANQIAQTAVSLLESFADLEIEKANESEVEDSSKKINEGMTADTAIEEGEIIDDEIRQVVDSMEVLEDWMVSDSLQDVLDYSGDNKEVIKRYVQEIEWEHGDINDGDDTPIAYERYFRQLLRAFKFRDEKRLKDWLNSSVDDYFPEQQDESMNEDVENKDDFNSLLDRIDWHSSSSLGNVYVPLQSIEAAVDLAKHLIGNGTFKAIQNVDDAQKLLDDVALRCGLKTPSLCFYDSMTFMRLFKIQKTTTGSFLLKALGSTFREALDASMKK